MLRLLLIALLLSVCTPAMAEKHSRTITVNGAGSAEVAPDRARLQVSIVAREASVDAAQKVAVGVTNKVLQMTDNMRIKRDHVDTTGVSIRADYRWNPKTEEQELRGYVAERRIAILVEDLDKLGDVVEGAVDAGVNLVSPPQLESSERKETLRQALRAAADDARANAKVLAETLGARLGEVISVNSGLDGPRPPMPYATNMRAMAAESDAAESYNAAELSFDAAVTVVFELTD